MREAGADLVLDNMAGLAQATQRTPVRPAKP
jgi:hypothetical protein